MVRTHSYLCGVSSIHISTQALSGASIEIEFEGAPLFFAAEADSLGLVSGICEGWRYGTDLWSVWSNNCR